MQSIAFWLEFCMTSFRCIWIYKAKQTTPDNSDLKFKHQPYEIDYVVRLVLQKL